MHSDDQCFRVLSFAGCAKKQDEKKTETSSEASTQEASAQVFAMDTYMNLKAYGKNAQKQWMMLRVRLSD